MGYFQVVEQVAGGGWSSGRSSGSCGSSGGMSGSGGSSGRSRSDGCSDPGVIQTDIGFVCDISTLSDNQKVKLLLNHFTPGDDYEFSHQAVQKRAKKWKLSYSPVKVGWYCKYCFLIGQLTRGYLRGLVKTPFVPRMTTMAFWPISSDEISPGCMCSIVYHLKRCSRHT